MDTENVNTANCTAGRCSHTYDLPSNPPPRYDGVSVAAESVVGVGAVRTCTTQTISELIIDFQQILAKIYAKFWLTFYYLINL